MTDNPVELLVQEVDDYLDAGPIGLYEFIWIPNGERISGSGDDLELPSRGKVRQTFLDVLAGRMSREDAASWADTWVVDTDPDVDDFVVWNALKDLSGIDLRVNATDYLHNEVDIHNWLDRVEEAMDDNDEGPA